MSKEQTIKIKVLIMRKGLTGSKIAKKIGVTREYVNGVIRFHWKTLWLRKAIASVLDVTYEECWGEPEPEEADKAA